MGSHDVVLPHVSMNTVQCPLHTKPCLTGHAYNVSQVAGKGQDLVLEPWHGTCQGPELREISVGSGAASCQFAETVPASLQSDLNFWVGPLGSSHLCPIWPCQDHPAGSPWGWVAALCLVPARKTLAIVSFGVRLWGGEKKKGGFFFFSFAYGGTDGPMIHKNCLQLNSHFAWLDLSVV